MIDEPEKFFSIPTKKSMNDDENPSKYSMTDQVDRLRKAGFSDDEIDDLLSNANRKKTKASKAHIDEHNRRVDEVADTIVWQEKLVVFALVVTLLLFGYITFSDNISSDMSGNLVMGWVAGIWILVIVGNVKSIPVYIRNMRFFFKK